MITQARYNTASHTTVEVISDGTPIVMSGYPSGTGLDVHMSVFIDEGGTISPYDPYYGMALDEVKEVGYSATDEELESRVYDAQHTPTVGVVLTDSDTRRANSKRDNKAKKKNNGISDADDHLYNHIDELDDFAETLRDQIEGCSDNACIQNVIDSIPTSAWPAWSPI